MSSDSRRPWSEQGLLRSSFEDDSRADLRPSSPYSSALLLRPSRLLTCPLRCRRAGCRRPGFRADLAGE